MLGQCKKSSEQKNLSAENWPTATFQRHAHNTSHSNTKSRGETAQSHVPKSKPTPVHKASACNTPTAEPINTSLVNFATTPPSSALQENTTKNVTESQPHGNTPNRFLRPTDQRPLGTPQQKLPSTHSDQPSPMDTNLPFFWRTSRRKS